LSCYTRRRKETRHGNVNIKPQSNNSLNIAKNTILSCIAKEFSRETVKKRCKQNVNAKSFTKAAR